MRNHILALACVLGSSWLVVGRTHYHSGGDSRDLDISDITLWINKDQGECGRPSDNIPTKSSSDLNAFRYSEVIQRILRPNLRDRQWKGFAASEGSQY